MDTEKDEKIKNKKEKKKEKKETKNNKELEKLKNELQETNEKILRLTAEMQNMRRRWDEERQRLLKYDGEAVIMNMLTILDNFEHAIKMDDANLTDEVSKFLSGFKMIYSNMYEALHNVGVEEIECLHQAFDENSMNAVLVESDPNFANNLVLDVLQKGYKYKDKVIRPAMVKVNQNEEKEGNENESR